MKTKQIILAILLILVLFSCNNKKTKAQETINTESLAVTNEHEAPKHKGHWGYAGETGPEHWAELEKESDCGGQFQSPINIVEVDAVMENGLKPLDIHYATSTKIHDVVNNGHSIQYNFEKGDYIDYNGKKFELKQIHFHESSEHTINGVRYPMVIHMVHTNSKGKYLVLAVMAEEGETSAPFEFLESYLPLKKGETKMVATSFNLNRNLPKDKGYFSYEGSLTTPPCTQGVNWIVFKEPITVSLQQVKILKELMPLNNYRTERPLNGRTVKMTK